MDKEDILNLEEGNAIDTLVAERVMGWHQVADNYGRHYWADKDSHYMHSVAPENGKYSIGSFEDDEDHHLINWNPSSSILWAWRVVEKLCEIGGAPVIAYQESDKWSCGYWLPNQRKPHIAYAETAPLVICRAALLAMEEK